MEIADRLLREGDLPGARAHLVDTVRANPGDPGARMFLFSLLCVGGEWDKARAQLNALAGISPEARMLSIVYGQAIDAEAQRAAVFAGRERVAVHAGGDWAQRLADALYLMTSGKAESATEAHTSALDRAPDTPGELDGERFDWIADADARFGPTFEAVIDGQYGLVAFDAVERITSEGPRDLRDFVWYPVQIAFREGQSAAALLPARYPGSEASAHADERLGRATNWTDGPGGQSGVGQHLWTPSTGEDQGLLGVRTLIFD